MALLSGIQKELLNLLPFFIHIYHAVSQKCSMSRWLLTAPQPASLPEPDMAEWGHTHSLYGSVLFRQRHRSSSWPSVKCA